jgi:hypothetical protein
LESRICQEHLPLAFDHATSYWNRWFLVAHPAGELVPYGISSALCIITCNQIYRISKARLRLPGLIEALHTSRAWTYFHLSDSSLCFYQRQDGRLSVPLQGSALVFTEVGVWGPAGLGLVKGADGGLVWKGRTPYRLGRMKAHRRWLQKEPVASQSWGSYIFSSFTCHHQLDGLTYPHIHTLQWSHMTVFCSCVYGLLHSTIVRMFERGI